MQNLNSRRLHLGWRETNVKQSENNKYENWGFIIKLTPVKNGAEWKPIKDEESKNSSIPNGIIRHMSECLSSITTRIAVIK